MSSNIIVILRWHDSGFVVTPKKAIPIAGNDFKDVARKLAHIASNDRVKAAFVYPFYMLHKEMTEMVEALEEAGYEQIRTLPTCFNFSLLLKKSKFTIQKGKSVCFFDPKSKFGNIFRKTANGFDCVNDIKISSLNHAMLCDSITYVIVDGDVTLPQNCTECTCCQDVNKKAYVHRTGLTDLLAGFDWSDFVNNPVFITLGNIQLYFSYNHRHYHVDVNYNQLPLTKTIELDIEDAADLSLHVNYGIYDSTLESVEFDDEKQRKIQVKLDVPITLIPEFTAKVVSETELVDYCVFLIEWNKQTGLFSGTHIIDDPPGHFAHRVVSNSATVKSVMSILSKYKPLMKLRGVMVDYLNTDEFPVNVHKNVVAALPTPTTKLIVGRIHANYSLHLWQSQVKVDQHEQVVFVDWTNIGRDIGIYHVFSKQGNGFKFLAEMKEFPEMPQDVIVAVENEPTTDDRQAALALFPHKKVIFSSRSTIPSIMMEDYAWHYFNGLDFYGYFVEPYVGYSLWIQTQTALRAAPANCGCDGYSAAHILRIGFEKVSSFMGECFSENPHVYLKYVGFKKPSLFVRVYEPDCFFIVLKIRVNPNLIPSGAVIDTDSSIHPSTELLASTIDGHLNRTAVISIMLIGNMVRLCCFYDGQMYTSSERSYPDAVNEVNKLVPLLPVKGIVALTGEHTYSQRLNCQRALLQLNDNVKFAHSFNTIMMKLYAVKARVKVGEAVLVLFREAVSVLRKHETGFKQIILSYDEIWEDGTPKLLSQPKKDILLFFKKYNIVLVTKMETTVKAPVVIEAAPKFLDLTPDRLLTVEISQAFTDSLLNGTCFGGYQVDPFDKINYEAEWDDVNCLIHFGVENLPFEVTKELDIGETSALKVYVTVMREKYLLKHYTMKTKKHRRVSLTMKQTNLCDISVSLVVLERGAATIDRKAEVSVPKTLAKSNTSSNAEKGSKPSTQSSKKVQSTDAPTSNPTATPSTTVTLTFTADSRILVDAGPNYTGDSEIPAYFWMELSPNGPIVTVGKEAKAAQKEHPKTVIYDIPGLLVANSDRTRSNPTWTFKTSRADDSTLLIHLGNDALTSPIPLFGSVVNKVFLYVKEHMKGDFDKLGIKLPEGCTISKKKLADISTKLGVKLVKL